MGAMMFPAECRGGQAALHLFADEASPVARSLFPGHHGLPLHVSVGGTIACDFRRGKMGWSDAYRRSAETNGNPGAIHKIIIFNKSISTLNHYKNQA